jgi:hypothetical protein
MAPGCVGPAGRIDGVACEAEHDGRGEAQFSDDDLGIGMEGRPATDGTLAPAE